MINRENKYNRYKGYTSEDLLLDEYFIQSMTNPTKESDAFWRKATQDGVLSSADYQLACYLFDSMQVQSESISNEEIDHVWDNIHTTNNHLKQIRRKKRNYFFFGAIGSVASLLLLFAYIELTTTPAKTDTDFSIENVIAPTEAITDIQLILSDNEAIALDGKEAEITYGNENIAINNDTKLKKQTHTNESIIYNQLIVPKGKRSTLIFEDGSKIWVNAGTRIVYPVVFANSEREIFVDGEIFLDVSYDTDRPFIVKSKDFNVEVLGTSFNFMAYESDNTHHVVLVSGTVNIKSNHDDTKAMLSPNEMFLLENNTTHIQKVNVNEYISWKTGMYQYQSERLDVIMKRLSRYYGEEITCKPEVAHLKCSGKLDLKDDLNIVLKGISQTAPVKYQVKDGIYMIVNK